MNRMKYPSILLAITVLIGMFPAGCSRDMKTYEELAVEGEVELMVRKDYKDFFETVRRLGDVAGATVDGSVDSLLLKETIDATDTVVEDMRPFPTTVRSRISLDALSYAAGDLAASPSFSNDAVWFYWRYGLLDPIFTKGYEYIRTGKTNDSTLYQLVMALQRGFGEHGTDDMLLDVIPVVGPAPSERVMELCQGDSLVFKKVYDLLMYTRSLQEIGPPLWMMTGPWFVAMDIEGWPLSFYCLNPLNLNNSLYLTFRTYTQGEVYAALFNDPAPEDPDLADQWLTRAAGAIDSLEFDENIIRRIKNTKLPVYDTHTYFDDYLLAATADSIKQEYSIVFKREKVEESSFQVVGADSIEIVLTQREIISRADTVTPLFVRRHIGDSIIGGRYISGKNGKGVAYLMPMGTHDENIMKDLQRSMMPEITVNTQ